jgi:selenocysteine lyase/cysteine desulfurase
MTAASNVCGTVMPLREIGQIARARGLYLIVDSAQAAGILPLTLNDLKADAICFTGHKSLLGPQGIGGLAISTEFNECKPLVTGGTGSSSHSEEVPTALPDRFEAGTQNLPGLIGLSAADKWLKGKEREILTHELELARHFINSIAEIKQVRLIGRDAMYCNPDQPGRIAAVSLDFPAEDNAEIAARLFDNYGIMTRCGLHCAPRAHKTLGTYPQGTVRFSFGWSNTRDEIDYAVSAIKNLVQR